MEGTRAVAPVDNVLQLESEKPTVSVIRGDAEGGPPERPPRQLQGGGSGQGKNENTKGTVEDESISSRPQWNSVFYCVFLGRRGVENRGVMPLKASGGNPHKPCVAPSSPLLSPTIAKLFLC